LLLFFASFMAVFYTELRLRCKYNMVQPIGV
jgi:hypothetical protein